MTFQKEISATTYRCQGAAFGDTPPCDGGGDGLDAESEDLARLIAEAKARALSSNTLRAYRTGIQNWTRWAEENGRPVFPARPCDLQQWLASLYKKGNKPSTIRTYRSAVAHMHRPCPEPNPALDHQVRQMLSGLNRMAADQGRTPKQADGLRWHHLLQYADAAYKPRFNQPRGRKENAQQVQLRAQFEIALLAVGIDAGLRRSEILALTWADVGPLAASGCATLRIRKSKTDQNGDGAVALISAYTHQALDRIKPPKAKPADPIFDISPSTLNRRIKTAAKEIGIDPTNISSHSLRVGMAQDLTAAGINLPGLMLAGRWKTAAMAIRYIRNLAAHHTPIAQYLKTRNNPAPPPSRNYSPPKQGNTFQSIPQAKRPRRRAGPPRTLAPSNC